MDYLSLMVAGLAGSPQMIHCTVLAITRIIFEYRKVNGYNCYNSFSYYMYMVSSFCRSGLAVISITDIDTNLQHPHLETTQGPGRTNCHQQ